MTPAPPAQVVIGLDVGTTGVKAAAFGLGSSWRSVPIREYPLLQPAPGEEVQDPATILTASGDALAECVATAGSAAVEGVCLQMRIILDRLDDVESVSSVRVTGGVFRSALWREVMAAMLARPIHVVGAAEGTALGAAALGLFALDRAPTPTDAVTKLSEAEALPPEAVAPDRQLVDTYDQLRASIPQPHRRAGRRRGPVRVRLRRRGGDAIAVTLDSLR